MKAWRSDRKTECSDAIEAAATITNRVKCINRELKAHAGQDDPLSKSTRAQVCSALHHHLIVCEGMTPAEASQFRENVPTVRSFSTPH